MRSSPSGCWRADAAPAVRPVAATAGCRGPVWQGLGLRHLAAQGEDLDGRPDRLKVTVVQGNIPQDVKWLPEFQQETVRIYRDLSLAAARSDKPGLVIWPEAATPFYYQDANPLSVQGRGAFRDEPVPPCSSAVRPIARSREMFTAI